MMVNVEAQCNPRSEISLAQHVTKKLKDFPFVFPILTNLNKRSHKEENKLKYLTETLLLEKNLL